MCSRKKNIEKTNEKLVHNLKDLIKCFPVNNRIRRGL